MQITQTVSLSTPSDVETEGRYSPQGHVLKVTKKRGDKPEEKTYKIICKLKETFSNGKLCDPKINFQL